MNGYEHVTRSEALAWAAGFFDGEGSTCFMGNYVILSISQNHREPLYRFREAIGYEAPIYGPYVYQDGRNNIYELRVLGIDRVNAALDILWPWLGIVKREQAQRARREWGDRPLTGRYVGPGPRVQRQRHREKHGDEIRARARVNDLASRTTQRAKVLAHYGETCACCGGWEKLQIRSLGVIDPPRNGVYGWLIRNGFPAGFETLCISCRMSKSKGKNAPGECWLPHAASGRETGLTGPRCGHCEGELPLDCPPPASYCSASCRYKAARAREYARRSGKRTPVPGAAYKLALAAQHCQYCQGAGAKPAMIRRAGTSTWTWAFLCPACLGAARPTGMECGWADEIEAGTQCVKCGAPVVHRLRNGGKLLFCNPCRAARRGARDELEQAVAGWLARITGEEAAK